MVSTSHITFTCHCHQKPTNLSLSLCFFVCTMHITKATGDAASDSNSSSASEVESLVDHDLSVSIHRRQLQRIATDGARFHRHFVPDLTKTNDGMKKTKRVIQAYQDHLRQRTTSEWIETLLPCYKWLQTYQWRSTLSKDVVAGVTVGAMIIPQSMSYAKLAGLPVQYGLYSALVPVYIYAFFGSSRQLAVGPVALISLLLATGLANILPQGNLSDEEYAQQYAIVAIQVSFLTGLVYIGMGLLRLGFVTIFLSHAVVSGFTTGAAIIIGVSQLKYIFGYNIERSDVLQGLIHNLAVNISQFNWKTFLMGTLSILFLAALKHIGKSYPKYKWVRPMGPLTVTALTILITWVFSFEDITVVGNIPKGLPNYTANLWTPISNFGGVMRVVVSVSIVGFMESIAIARKLAAIHKYELDSSLELIGLGMANFMGAMFQSYPVTGSFSRSAVNNDTGAESGISGAVTATLVMLVLLFLTPVFEHMVSVCLLR